MVQYLDRVGKIHTQFGGNKAITVDYIHINVLLAYVEDVLISCIFNLSDDSIQKLGVKDAVNFKCKLIRAFNKLLWIQNDFFAKYYVPEPSSDS